MNLLFLRPQPGIRSLKYALAFEHAGFSVNIFHGYVGETLTEYYGYGDEYFTKFIKLDLRKLEGDIRRVVDKYQIDLIHSQNAPDYLTVSAIKAVGNTPIIHGNQDVISMRKTPYTPGEYPGSDRKSQLLYEKIANEQCDARIHVSDGVFEYIKNNYGPNKDLIFYNYVSESMVPSSFTEKLSKKDGQIHIVYEGSLASQKGDHYDLIDIFKGIAHHRLHIHIYAANENLDYKKLAEENNWIHYHGHLDPRKLFTEITRYDFGWAGFNSAKNKTHMEVALPNKIMEYLACGLPTLTLPHKTQKNFIEKHGIGFVVEDLEALPAVLSDKKPLVHVQENVLRQKLQFTFERNVDKIINLYTTLL